MALIREENNEIKRQLIKNWVQEGWSVLDVGCGQGGDIHKWAHVRIKKLVGVDPNPSAIEEARRRSRNYPWSTFHVGTIESAPLEHFDVICYNFSLQYQSLDLITEITRRLKPDGLLIGTVTDSSRLDQSMIPKEIKIEWVNHDKISVYIANTPYYANGPVIEPILSKHSFIRAAENIGLRLQLWEPFSIYAKFVFRY